MPVLCGLKEMGHQGSANLQKASVYGKRSSSGFLATDQRLQMKDIKKIQPDWGQINWDLSSPEIRCKLDSIGASVYEFSSEDIRILAHSREAAKEVLMMYLQDNNIDDE